MVNVLPFRRTGWVTRQLLAYQRAPAVVLFCIGFTAGACIGLVVDALLSEDDA